MAPLALATVIRPAQVEDLAAINEIYNYHVAHGTGTFDTEPLPLEERVRWFESHGDRFPVLVSEEGGEVIGWASLSPFHARPAYRFTVEDSVYVREDQRGKGVGLKLVQDLLVLAEKRGFRSVMAVIGDSDNLPSVVIHERLGFRHLGVEQEVGYKFGRWLDVVLMQWTASGRPV